MTRIEGLQRCAVLQAQAAFLHMENVRYHRGRARIFKRQARKLQRRELIKSILLKLPCWNWSSQLLDQWDDEDTNV